MDHAAYDAWWEQHTDADGELLPLDEPAATLAAHVRALQDRLDRLPDPHAADRGETNAWSGQCACAYEHPQSRCMTHAAT